ncbi:MAG: 3-isopropylmalate dehydratase small subunit [Planctomycetaceae bacterium]
MSTHQITKVQGRAIPLLADDIDTDRIIPARFLRCVTFDGLGAHAFEDDRLQDDEHPFNQERFSGARVLVAGRNFGCGSSREHAPQALSRWGVAAIVAESFAEIFFGNCTALGIPAVTLDRERLEVLVGDVETDPTVTVTVDLENDEVRWEQTSAPSRIPTSARLALVSGDWDFLSQLLATEDQVRRAAATLPYMAGFPGS